MSVADQYIEPLTALDHDAAVETINAVLQERPEVAPQVVNFACPYLTYAPTRSMVERRPSGTIKSFNHSSGFGFISCPELFEVFQSDVFIHRSQVYGVNGGYPTPGLEVSFAVFLNKDQKPQGYDITPLHGKGGGGKGKWDNMSHPMANPWGGAPMGGGMKGGGGWQGAVGGYAAPAKGKGKISQPRAVAPEDVLGQYSGVVKSFNHSTGYGFIACEEMQQQGYQDVFLHVSNIGDFEVGHEVMFEAYLHNGKPNAHKLESAGGGVKRGAPDGGFQDFAKFPKLMDESEGELL